jgi:putative DNA primase/helicase
VSERIQDAARGKWRDILRAIGMTERQLSGFHSACPICTDGGGKDRFRFDDKRGEGTWICNRCGAGAGVDLVMKFRGVDFMGAKAEIERHIGTAKFSAPKAQVSNQEAQIRAARGWGFTSDLTGTDPASLWLARRGINPSVYSSALRWSAEVPYRDEAQVVSNHPAMVAKFSAPDGATYALHRTFLTTDGFRADVGDIRKMAPGPIPDGGAVRLAPAAETMGVGTGIETSYSAMRMFRLPVWATLNDRLLMKWKPPSAARRIIVFGDHDDSFSGQMAAYGLAFTLKQKGFDVEVRIPPTLGQDWNDVDMADQGLDPPQRSKEPRHGNDARKILEYQGDWA